MIKVEHASKYREDKEVSVYIGRDYYGWTGSPLGNPFKIGIDGSREEVVEKYEKFLRGKINEGNQSIISALRYLEKQLAECNEQGKDLVLLCWCHPHHPCHGDIIKEYLEDK